MTEALKSSTAVQRFIVVQQDAQALFGLFSVAAVDEIWSAIADEIEDRKL